MNALQHPTGQIMTDDMFQNLIDSASITTKILKFEQGTCEVE